MALTYLRGKWNPALCGPWAEWQAQLPGLPDQGTPEDFADWARMPVTFTDASGQTRTEPISWIASPEMRGGQLWGWGYLVTKRVETRSGRCQVCDLFSTKLTLQTDASGISGWACDDHDELDLVFA